MNTVIILIIFAAVITLLLHTQLFYLFF